MKGVYSEYVIRKNYTHCLGRHYKIYCIIKLDVGRAFDEVNVEQNTKESLGDGAGWKKTDNEVKAGMD